jgi:predicted transcriptional regulator
MPDPLRDWYSPAVTVEIAGELLAAHPGEPVRADGLAPTLRRSERGIRELLDRLYRGQLVSRAALHTGEAGRPRWGYWLADEQRPAAQRAVDTPEELRKVVRKRRGESAADDRSVAADAARGSAAISLAAVIDHAAEAESAPDASAHANARAAPRRELVIVDSSGSAYAHLLEALSGTRKADAATSVIRVGHEVVFVFDTSSAAHDADALLAVLGGARLLVRSASVREVITAAEFVAHAQHMAPEIRRTRSTRDAHDTPQ